jgi:hypothetical protein
MPADDVRFRRNVLEQIAINQARTPTERCRALCGLLDSARAMAPKDDAARERRRRALIAREKAKRKWREQCRRYLASGGADT